ncbi:MAG: hypothetical protein GQ559_00805 [Desulfobulbaceae bacterium]|nr:hypothetical protein [Desulfobulbaceae bacterium]
MKKYIVAISLSALLSPAVSFAQDPIVYPAKGQDAQQTEKDKFECYNWAKGQTGFDPMQSPQASTPPPAQTTQSGRGGSVVRGAAVGGLAGSMGGEFGKGAAVGAAAGLVGGGIRQRRQAGEQQARQDEWARQESNNYNQQRSQYNRAFGACLEGRGYTVR